MTTLTKIKKSILKRPNAASPASLENMTVYAEVLLGTAQLLVSGPSFAQELKDRPAAKRLEMSVSRASFLSQVRKLMSTY